MLYNLSEHSASTYNSSPMHSHNSVELLRDSESMCYCSPWRLCQPLASEASVLPSMTFRSSATETQVWLFWNACFGMPSCTKRCATSLHYSRQSEDPAWESRTLCSLFFFWQSVFFPSFLSSLFKDCVKSSDNIRDYRSL